MEEIKDTTTNTSYGTYDTWVDCKNCGERNRVKISRGTLVKDTPCPNCGTKSVFKVN